MLHKISLGLRWLMCRLLSSQAIFISAFDQILLENNTSTLIAEFFKAVFNLHKNHLILLLNNLSDFTAKGKCILCFKQVNSSYVNLLNHFDNFENDKIMQKMQDKLNTSTFLSEKNTHHCSEKASHIVCQIDSVYLLWMLWCYWLDCSILWLT